MNKRIAKKQAKMAEQQAILDAQSEAKEKAAKEKAENFQRIADERNAAAQKATEQRAYALYDYAGLLGNVQKPVRTEYELAPEYSDTNAAYVGELADEELETPTVVNQSAEAVTKLLDELQAIDYLDVHPPKRNLRRGIAGFIKDHPIASTAAAVVGAALIFLSGKSCKGCSPDHDAPTPSFEPTASVTQSVEPTAKPTSTPDVTPTPFETVVVTESLEPEPTESLMESAEVAQTDPPVTQSKKPNVHVSNPPVTSSNVETSAEPSPSASPSAEPSNSPSAGVSEEPTHEHKFGNPINKYKYIGQVDGKYMHEKETTKYCVDGDGANTKTTTKEECHSKVVSYNSHYETLKCNDCGHATVRSHSMDNGYDDGKKTTYKCTHDGCDYEYSVTNTINTPDPIISDPPVVTTPPVSDPPVITTPPVSDPPIYTPPISQGDDIDDDDPDRKHQGIDDVLEEEEKSSGLDSSAEPVLPPVETAPSDGEDEERSSGLAFGGFGGKDLLSIPKNLLGMLFSGDNPEEGMSRVRRK